MTDLENNPAHILIVDDEPLVRNILQEMLCEKYECAVAGSAEEALTIIQKEIFNLVVTDIDMDEMSGIEMIPHVHEILPDAVVVMIGGKQTIESAIEAMRIGAFDFIQKPFDIEHVEIAVERALEHHKLIAEKRRYDTHLEEVIKQRTEQLNYLAYHDALTDLPNRALYEDRLSQSLALAHQNQNSLAVILLSLDRFKKIHDTLGHAAGYSVLREVAERLKKCASGGETLARFEGDEFALLLTQMPDARNVVEIINDINEALKQPIVINEHEVFITPDIGISLFPDDGGDAQTLIKNSGAALSRAREQGEYNYQFYTTDMNSKALHRLELENKLRRALEREEFEVYYQPKITAATGKIAGMEALVRWRHPELGLVSPAEFIPLAEETGLIIPLGEWVLQTACSQGKAWRDRGFFLDLSVNLSARQFQQRNLLATIIGIIQKTGFNPQCLELEVTESSIMKDAGYAVRVLDQLKNAGIKISLDDFGTGYSSLSYLKRLPIDILKIDKSFVRDITTSSDDAALVTAIITLSHNLRLKVIAEGVETEEQREFLHRVKCDSWQGYLYSKPLPPAGFEELLIKENSEAGTSKSAG